MIQQVENLVHFLNQLPVTQQARVAEILLKEAQYEISESPKNRAWVEQLIQETEEDINQCNTMSMREFIRKAQEQRGQSAK